MKMLSSLLLVILMQACKQPLSIEGQGDIVDLNQSGYGCTLEQFQSNDLACANDVQGDYFVNYAAEPRDGWVFDRWEGSCGHLSIAPRCRFDVSAAWVVVWDENLGSVEIPPLKAIFHQTTTPSKSPYSGTIFIDPDIVLPSDASAFVTASYTGRGIRTMFDRRVNNWVNHDVFLFNATYNDGKTIEVQVNPEFATVESAHLEADKYAWYAGQLPAILREDVETMWIHLGVNAFGGGNANLLIHTGQAEDYINNGIIEETLIHEAAHTSLDAYHAASEGWLQAQQADPVFISTYARDNPTREDIAESFLPWFAVRHRADRISDGMRTTILDAIPNRITYFDQQTFSLHPAVQ